MTPNAHGGKTRQLRFQTRTQDKTNPEWLTFTTVKRLSFKALQTSGILFADFIPRRRPRETVNFEFAQELPPPQGADLIEVAAGKGRREREVWRLEAGATGLLHPARHIPQNELKGVLSLFRRFDFNQVVRERRSVAKISKYA
jgi:hypothetical protein